VEAYFDKLINKMKTKKELKEEYIRIKPKIGVYQISNIINGKVFIDSSPNLDKIWNRHSMELNFGNHRNVPLQKDWNEFGEINFKYEILSEIKQTDDQTIDYTKDAKLLAKMYIEELKPFGDKGYN
jgi:hypothetical protein